ncbi:MAG: Gfo/Idh/MocA family oxidoreductase [Clostridiales bacterium]|nr:Gfo/Idh/MocA family oxidoreductase [Clostridiales bacterium]
MNSGKFRVAIISAGMIANAAHIPAYRNMLDECEVVAVCDINEEAARQTAARHGIPGVYADAEEMLLREKPDLVSICTSNAAHLPMAKLALECGANVLCEKPLGTSYPDALEAFETARRMDKILVACQSARFTPEHLDARSLAVDGALGDVYFAEINRVRRRGVPTWGNFHRKDINLGGAFCDIGVHVLDAAVWIMGNPKIQSVTGASGNRLTKKGECLVTSLAEAGAPLGRFGAKCAYKPDEFETEEFAAGSIRFENGALLNFKVAWALNLPNSASMSIVGDRAGLLLPEFKLITAMGKYQADVEPRRFNEERPYRDKPFNGHWQLIENVVNHLRGREELVIKPEETLNVTAAIDAFYRSAELKREVTFAEIEARP